MAARKKVTKKVSTASERAGSNRSKAKSARNRTATPKPVAATKSAKRAKASTKDAAPKKAAALKKATAAKNESVSKRGAASKKTSARGKVSSVKQASEKTTKLTSVDNNLAASSKKGVAAPANTAKVAIVAKSAPKPEKSTPAPQAALVETAAHEQKFGDSKDIARRSAKGAESAPARSDSGLPSVSAEATTKPTPVEKPVLPTASAPAALTIPQNAAKAVKAPPPLKANDRDQSGGEQKNMKNSANKHGFKLNEFVVYPAHGVGQIVAMEEQEVAGFKLELFVINFVKDKMTLRVPTAKVTGVGMRKLSDPEAARRALEILTGRARVKRTMWSRRAQEYEAKINSGDINAIAEVVRDLYRSEAQPEQSYSERQLYEAALDRMMREIAAVQKTSEIEALKVIDAQLKKNQKRGVKPEGAEGEEVEEAA